MNPTRITRDFPRPYPQQLVLFPLFPLRYSVPPYRKRGKPEGSQPTAPPQEAERGDHLLLRQSEARCAVQDNTVINVFLDPRSSGRPAAAREKRMELSEDVPGHLLQAYYVGLVRSWFNQGGEGMQDDAVSKLAIAPVAVPFVLLPAQ